MFEWCENLMEVTGCDMETAMREYYAEAYPDIYDPVDYEDV